MLDTVHLNYHIHVFQLLADTYEYYRLNARWVCFASIRVRSATSSYRCIHLMATKYKKIPHQVIQTILLATLGLPQNSFQTLSLQMWNRRIIPIVVKVRSESQSFDHTEYSIPSSVNTLVIWRHISLLLTFPSHICMQFCTRL